MPRARRLHLDESDWYGILDRRGVAFMLQDGSINRSSMMSWSTIVDGKEKTKESEDAAKRRNRKRRRNAG